MEQIIIELAQKYPAAVAVLTAIGVLRAVFKPIMTVLDKFVESTPSASDDALLGKLKESKIYKGIAWFVDYTASIKLPGQK